MRGAITVHMKSYFKKEVCPSNGSDELHYQREVSLLFRGPRDLLIKYPTFRDENLRLKSAWMKTEVSFFDEKYYLIC